MKPREVKRGEKHHWWPKSLSRHWANEHGLVHRVDSSGEVILSNPKGFGLISDGHNILFDGGGPWESTIEPYFDRPDSNMTHMVSWLSSLRQEVIPDVAIERPQLPHDVSDENLNTLRECIISLAARSPNYREAHNSYVEQFRGSGGIAKSESKSLIAMNIHQKYKTLVRNTKGLGKFAILFSGEKEFIFGDGFYSNITATTEYPYNLKAVVPMTPHIAVVWSSPMACRSYPKLISVHVDTHTVKTVNESVQVYSREYLFFRAQLPELMDDFRACEHREYRQNTDPVAELIDSLIPDDSKKGIWGYWI